MNERHQAMVDAIRQDGSSSATDILLRVTDLLVEIAPDWAALTDLASACVRAQPSMAGLITLEALVREAPEQVAAIERFREQVRRAPRAIARHTAALLLLTPEPRAVRPALRVVTCSSSRAVEATLRILHDTVDLSVCCAEGRPKLEGVGLAGRLAASGIAVDLYTDAGISAAVPGSDAVLVGADAIGPDDFVNKVGTAALCAWAGAAGVPAYALAGREKVLTAKEMGRLVLADGPPPSSADEAPAGVAMRNPYFERIPLALLSLLVTDAGPRVTI